MSALTITLRGPGLDAFAAGLQAIGSKARREMERGLINGGDKLRTEVRKALKDQTGVIRYGAITSGVKGRREGLSYIISSTGSGLPIKNFKTRWSRSLRGRVRWSAREHWKLQARTSDGRFDHMMEGADTGGVTSSVWNAPRTFQRSYAEGGEFYAVLPGSRSRRKLYGPSLPKELPVGKSVATWEAGTSTILDAVMDRLEGLMA